MKFSILGPVQAQLDGQLVALGAPKQRALLAVLLLARGAVVSRDWLIDSLWEDDPPATAAKSLQVYVHGLRRGLGAERIETAGAGYRVRLDDADLDLDRFERLTEQGRRALAAGDPEGAAEELRQALALWRGPALADLPRTAATVADAERLEELRLAAVELKNDAELASGRHDAIVAELDALVAEHPYRERFLEQRILALYRSGRQNDALEAYRSARRALAEELGLEPGQALQELERAILRQEPALAAPEAERRVKPRLPAPPTPLVGRHLEVAAVAGLFREEGVRLVTLTGTGGTGKTRLALAVAAVLEDELLDGALFVDLAPVRNGELLLPTIAEALEVQEGDRPLGPAVAEHLAPKRMLLVLDNLEQLLPATPAIAELLAQAPRLLVLVTSRSPLRLSGEHEYHVPPLPTADDRLPFEALVQTDAVRLFAARARAVDPNFQLTEDGARTVARICRSLDGLPLAIELAAARSRLLSPAEMFDRLEEQPQLLGSGPRDAPARQQTLSATIEWSYDLLDAGEREAFAELAVFAGGCTLDAAEQVCETDLGVIGSLLDNSLLQRQVASAEPRFTMLETIRHYALDRLDATDGDLVRERHAEWLTELAETAESEMQSTGVSAAWLDRLQAEHDNIRAALGWALAAARPEIALRLASALRLFWEVRGHFNEGARWLDQALAEGSAEAPALRAKALGIAGTVAFRRGRLEEAKDRFEEALELWRELGDEGGIARCLSDLGTVAAAVEDWDEATELLEESAARFRALDEPTRLAIVLANLGHIAHAQGDYLGSIDVTTEALALERQRDHKPNQAISLYNLGSSCLGAGQHEQALVWLRESVALTFELGYKEVMAYALATVVRIRLLEGEAHDAARLAGVADELLADAGVSLQPREQELFEDAKRSAREQLGDDFYGAAHAEGRLAPLREALVRDGILEETPSAR
jgi:predicted ATPase/DNA-binding SARP family transcriptional activator